MKSLPATTVHPDFSYLKLPTTATAEEKAKAGFVGVNTMVMEHNMVGWFEIPVTDMERAKAFYEAVFEIDIQVHQMGGVGNGLVSYGR